MPREEVEISDAILLEQLYAYAPIGLCCFDSDLNFIRINDRLANMHDLPVKEHLGKKVTELLPSISHVYENNIIQALKTGEPIHCLSNIEFPNSTFKKQLFELFFYPVRSDDEITLNKIGFTIYKVTERELIREKIALAASNFWLIKHLTNREFEIVELASEKLYDKEIASRLSISVETVKTHMKKIFKKLKVNNRREAIAKVQSLKILNFEAKK